MPEAPKPRAFAINPALEGVEPLCIGLMGPPGGGKTVSALRLGTGMARIHGGKPAVIDTEAGRARKYHISRNPDGFDFDYISFAPPFIPSQFLDAIKAAAALNPSCIIVDNASDEHEGPGGVLEWHDRDVPKFKGNEWAAWNEPKRSRRILTAGIQQIRIPIIMTFRARPKTKVPEGQRNPVALGYMPIAGEELLGIMDLTCLLPPRSNGVAVWNSDKAGEDFVIKVPNYIARLIRRGAPIDENFGEALARWQLGNDAPPVDTAPRQLTAGQWADAYIAGLNSTEIESVSDLLEYIGEETRAAGLERLKANAKAAAHVDRIVEAQGRRHKALTPDEEVRVEDDKKPEDE